MTKQTNMLKLMNSVIILVILYGDVHSIDGEVLQCEFLDVDFNWGSLYTCKVTSLDNSKNNMVIKSHTGTHNVHKNDKDVKAIYIYGANLKYIPHGLGSLSNLLGLVIYNSQLVEIRSKDFQGMQNLEYLSLYDNKLTSIPLDAFSSLAKLKNIDLDSNKFKYIGYGAFDKVTNLNKVDLRRNICVNKLYEGTSAISQMKEDLKVNCVEPLSTSTTTTTTTTTTQNPMEVELEALKNEAKDQQQKNEIELNKLRDDLKKEQSENIKVNKEKDGWIEKHDELKEESNNKTSEINELKEKEDVKLNELNGMKQNQEDLKKMMKQLLKASQEHQLECNEIIKLRAELVTAKEDQKKEQLENLEVTKEKNALMKKKDALMIYHNALKKEKDQLKKELTEAKATCKINERSLI